MLHDKGDMDPKNPTDLDPKLKETYERVMGTVIPNPPAQTPSDGAQAPQSKPTSEPIAPNLAAQTNPAPIESVPSETFQPTFVPPPAVSAQTQVFSTTKKSKISPFILVLGAIAFFIIYLIIWVKVFGLHFLFF